MVGKSFFFFSFTKKTKILKGKLREAIHEFMNVAQQQADVVSKQKQKKAERRCIDVV